jgi:CRISPR-associated endonuclease/helicase Cas3
MCEGGFPIILHRNDEPNQIPKNAPPILSGCIAKIMLEEPGKARPGLDVETHCKIVGSVARELVNRFPCSIRERLFPEGVELIAAVHDIGKINPHFQEKLRRVLPGYIPNSDPALRNANPDLEKNIGMHGGVSQVALEGVGLYIPEIAGMHHGSSPDSLFFLPEDTLLGGPEWQKARMESVAHLKGFFRCDWPKIGNNAQATVIAGLTTVSDWIGSGPVFEQLSTIDPIHYDAVVREAVDRAGFIFPKLKRGLSFDQVFPSYTPRSIQRALYESVQSPGVYILEALMGSGKTEAALYAAYRMIETGQANGIYFALPTRITSEKIHERMDRFLDAILTPEDQHKTLLAHGSAWLVDSDMGENARPGYEWFDSRKRKLLAPFAVGTIDQALMAVMNVRHGFVRAFGLAGKVVVLDEVHTYDAYTGSIMDTLIHTLRELGSTVILLSATLTEERKRFFMADGRRVAEEVSRKQYPLVSKSIGSQPIEYSPPIHSCQSKVQLSLVQDEDSLVESIRARALAGEHVLWIENTVQEAQKVFKSFASWGQDQHIQVGLLHSRFPVVRRNELESFWVDIYGKEGIPERKGIGKILVGTQVLEQSLDLDADLLVTRIAPTDMILQRIGRLWRHREIDCLRPDGARRQALILAPPLQKVLQNPKWGFGPSGKVYAPYVLVRSLLVFQELGAITVPADMRSLIEDTYRERYEDSAPMREAKNEVAKNREILQSFANNSMTMIGKAASDSITTRYSEKPSCDVLLLLEGSDLANGLLQLVDGETIQVPNSTSLCLAQKKRLAKACMLRMISMPAYLAPDPVSVQELVRLRPFLYVSDVEEDRLRVAVLSKSGVIRGLYGKEANEKYELEYSSLFGYATKKKEGV